MDFPAAKVELPKGYLIFTPETEKLLDLHS